MNQLLLLALQREGKLLDQLILQQLTLFHPKIKYNILLMQILFIFFDIKITLIILRFRSPNPNGLAA